nr:RNA-directed DNA polymerase, eukaryota, reverse transcriptase zinc-binding domain protein [Tanacetum cinerariifolium]
VSDRRVCGEILAYYDKFDYGDDKSFYKASLLESFDGSVLEDGDVPLTRSMMVVPIKGSLIIEAHLTDFDSEFVILHGCCVFSSHCKDSLKYLPVFTPNEEGDVPVEKVDNWSDENRVNNGQVDEVCVGQHVHERVDVSNDTHESTYSGHFKKSKVPRKDGSILELIDDIVNAGQTMGYDMTGYFNEARDISERFGSIFNKHGAEAFNSFIVNAGLVEVPLLSNHRPIIMREAHYDYGTIPFKFFHYWFELDGFDKLVEQTWLETNVNDQNSYSKFMNKLKYLKEKTQIWARLHKESLNSRKSILKADLADLDGVIDKGEGSDANGHRRREVVRLIQEVKKADVIEVAQKAKIKWSIEGDENSKYYHDIPKGGNSCFITLIPKVPNANMVKDIRPISLIGSLYKVIAKVLANRLVTVLGDVVDEIQSAFVTDRQILDGSRVGDLMSRIQSWHDVTKGMHTRLSKWKLKTLSIGGRLTLLKSVLGAIPIYHMSIFKVSMKVLQNMESICACFFNGADVNSKKPNWVRWKSVLAAKDIGGHEVSSLFVLNRALMFKWVWSFITPKLGNGDNTSFWDVAWCGDIAFINLVPRLYALESMKNIEVASKLSHGGREFSFRRNPRGGMEQAQFERLKEMVECVTLINSNDKRGWSLVGSGDFSVSSVRKLIDNAILPKGISKTRWIKECQWALRFSDTDDTTSLVHRLSVLRFGDEQETR